MKTSLVKNKKITSLIVSIFILVMLVFSWYFLNNTIQEEHYATIFYENKISICDSSLKYKVLTYEEFINEIYVLEGENNIHVQESINDELKENQAFIMIDFQFEVTSEYSPSIIIYAKANMDNKKINDLCNIFYVTLNLYDTENDILKVFTGELFYNLENEREIFFWLNGTFDNEGLTNIKTTFHKNDFDKNNLPVES